MMRTGTPRGASHPARVFPLAVASRRSGASVGSAAATAAILRGWTAGRGHERLAAGTLPEKRSPPPFFPPPSALRCNRRRGSRHRGRHGSRGWPRRRHLLSKSTKCASPHTPAPGLPRISPERRAVSAGTTGGAGLAEYRAHCRLRRNSYDRCDRGDRRDVTRFPGHTGDLRIRCPPHRGTNAGRCTDLPRFTSTGHCPPFQPAPEPIGPACRERGAGTRAAKQGHQAGMWRANHNICAGLAHGSAAQEP